MPSAVALPVLESPPSEPEAALQRVTAVYVATGMLFMLLPGTFLGVWNLISISSRHSLTTLSASWLQAHGHAQMFGWIGTFVIGIVYYSLSKMWHLAPFAVTRAWMSWALWTGGLLLRWVANVYLRQWHVIFPLSGAAELAAFLIFFRTVSGHRSTPGNESRPRKGIETWMKLV